MTVEVHEVRLRQTAIHDRLRLLGLRQSLPLDVLYVQGEFDRPQWDVGHLFRADRLTLCNARAKGHVRPSRFGAAPLARQERNYYIMRDIGIERAMLCQRVMTEECFETALVLIAEVAGDVEPQQARRAAWELAQVYDGTTGIIRWRDGQRCG